MANCYFNTKKKKNYNSMYFCAPRTDDGRKRKTDLMEFVYQISICLVDKMSQQLNADAVSPGNIPAINKSSFKYDECIKLDPFNWLYSAAVNWC